MALMGATSLQADTISIPNSSFELPPTGYASPFIDSWQQVPDPSTSIGSGVFLNTTNGSVDHLDNCDGVQAAFLFSAPGVGIYQDYNSVDYAHTNPTHNFNMLFEVGKSYDLTVGFAVSYSSPPASGDTLQVALYYRDVLSNMVIVGSTNVIYDTNQLSATHFRDVQVHIATVRPTNAWAGKNIGISIFATLGAGGAWDVDNVRLSSTAITLTNASFVSGHFTFNVQSEPGLRFEILAGTNVSAASNWTSIGSVTNSTGTVPFSDPSGNLGQRFYRARQLP